MGVLTRGTENLWDTDREWAFFSLQLERRVWNMGRQLESELQIW